MASAVARAPAADAVACGGGFEADHGALHALVGGEAEEWVSSGVLVDFRRGRGGTRSRRGRSFRLRGRGARLALMAKLAARARAGGAAMLVSARKWSRVAWSS